MASSQPSDQSHRSPWKRLTDVIYGETSPPRERGVSNQRIPSTVDDFFTSSLMHPALFGLQGVGPNSQLYHTGFSPAQLVNRVTELMKSAEQLSPLMPTAPTSDVVETDKNYKIVVELPGLTTSDVKIETEDAKDGVILTIDANKTTAEEKDIEDKSKVKWHRMERSSTSYHRSFHFPSNADKDLVHAKMAHGVLTVVIDKVPEPQPEAPKKVNIPIEDLSSKE
eukprot:gene8073-9589_t